MDFEKKVLKLAKELEGKNLRQEWATNREALKRDFTMSTSELHKAFALIGPAQEAAKEQKIDTLDILKGMNKERAIEAKTAATEAARVKKEAKAKIKADKAAEKANEKAAIKAADEAQKAEEKAAADAQATAEAKEAEEKAAADAPEFSMKNSLAELQAAYTAKLGKDPKRLAKAKLLKAIS